MALGRWNQQSSAKASSWMLNVAGLMPWWPQWSGFELPRWTGLEVESGLESLALYRRVRRCASNGGALDPQPKCVTVQQGCNGSRVQRGCSGDERMRTLAQRRRARTSDASDILLRRDSLLVPSRGWSPIRPAGATWTGNSHDLLGTRASRLSGASIALCAVAPSTVSSANEFIALCSVASGVVSIS